MKKRSFRERAKFSWRSLRSSRRILQSPIPNEHPGGNQDIYNVDLCWNQQMLSAWHLNAKQTDSICCSHD